MSEEGDYDDELIKHTFDCGEITHDSKNWDDLEEFGKNILLKLKIIKIKIYSGTYKGKKAIVGVEFTYRNLLSDETFLKEHKGTEQFYDIKEFDIKKDEYLTDFHIRFPDDAEYISQLGFNANKGNKILVGTEEGEDKDTILNGKDNIIIGTRGFIDKKLDAFGVMYVNRKKYFIKRYFSLFMLHYLVKKDKKFKKETQDKIPEEFKYVWKTANLRDDLFFNIVKYIMY